MWLEYSRGLAGEPGWQYGVSMSWRSDRHTNPVAGYLCGADKYGRVGEDRDSELRHRKLPVARLASEFR